MSGQFLEINGIRVYLVSANGPEMRTDKDAVDLMSAASDQHAEFFAIPVERLGDAFFELRTRIAGQLVQKFVMYGKRVAIVGEISQRIATSKSLTAFVAESNRGRDLWFVKNLEDLGNRFSMVMEPSDLG